jgi:hypothetical protein
MISFDDLKQKLLKRDDVRAEYEALAEEFSPAEKGRLLQQRSLRLDTIRASLIAATADPIRYSDTDVKAYFDRLHREGSL